MEAGSVHERPPSDRQAAAEQVWEVRETEDHPNRQVVQSAERKTNLSEHMTDKLFYLKFTFYFFILWTRNGMF